MKKLKEIEEDERLVSHVSQQALSASDISQRMKISQNNGNSKHWNDGGGGKLENELGYGGTRVLDGPLIQTSRVRM